jgi:hypothetical protein
MTNLPRDIARCDGMLPELVLAANKQMARLWTATCPQRDQCARYVQMRHDAPDTVGEYIYSAHAHQVGTPCIAFYPESQLTRSND